MNKIHLEQRAANGDAQAMMALETNNFDPSFNNRYAHGISTVAAQTAFAQAKLKQDQAELHAMRHMVLLNHSKMSA